MTNLDTPKNKTDQADKKFVNKAKKAAAILVAALGLTVAGQQSANAQMFSTEGDETELAEIDKQNEQKRNTIADVDKQNKQKNNTIADVDKQNADKRKRNAENLEVEKDLDAEIALLKRKKGDKQSKTITREEAKVFAKKD